MTTNVDFPGDTAERELATIVRIEQVVKHEGADNLSLVKVKGWQVVIQTSEFLPGDLAIYCEIDSILPPKLLEGLTIYDRLAQKKFTIKTIRLRGEYSQGILLPLDLLNRTTYALESSCTVDTSDTKCVRLGELSLGPGADVTTLLGITKHEPPIFIEDGDFKMPIFKGSFPTHLMPMTNEVRVQNIPAMVANCRGKSFFVTEKVDGTSFTCYRKGKQFSVCSRNNELLETETDMFWRTARRLDIKAKLVAAGLDQIALQGELLGPKIQANRYRLQEPIVLFFNVIDITNRRYYSTIEAKKLVEEVLKLQWVPMVDPAFILNHTTSELVALADGKSLLNPSIDREGLVFRGCEENTDDYFRRVSFKCISNRWLLKFDTTVQQGTTSAEKTDKVKAKAKKKGQPTAETESPPPPVEGCETDAVEA